MGILPILPIIIPNNNNNSNNRRKAWGWCVKKTKQIGKVGKVGRVKTRGESRLKAHSSKSFPPFPSILGGVRGEMTAWRGICSARGQV